MLDTGQVGSSAGRRISRVLTLLIVLELTFSGLLVGAPLAGQIGGTQVVPAVDGRDVAAAERRAGKRDERSRDRKQKDHKRKESDRHENDAKEPSRERQERSGKKREGKGGRRTARSQDDSPNHELASGRLPAALAVAAADGMPLSARDRYIVVLDETTTNAFGVASDIAAASPGVVPTHVYSHLFQGFAAVIPDRALEDVRGNPQVKAVVPDEVVYSAAHEIPAGVDRIDADENSTASIDGFDDRVDVDVAVIDTAGFGDHPDVNEWAWANCTDSPNNSDDQGHGTHVGGTIGALDNGIGVVGVAPGARLWNFRALIADPAGGSAGMTSWVICALDLVRQYATPQPDGLGDIEVVNASLGRPGTDSDCWTQVDPYHWAYCKVVNAGVTVVVAAMNDAQDATNVVPATYAEVITVSALADSDGQPGGFGPVTSAGRDDSLATFSNYGAEINIAAPGVDILSTVPTGFCEICNPSGYEWMNGTSMAAPHVAGAAALYLATHPGASPAQVKAELINNRDRISLPGDPDGIDEGVLYVGDGSAPPSPPPPPPPPPPPTVEPGAGGESSAVAKKQKKKQKKQKKQKKHKKKGGKGKKKR